MITALARATNILGHPHSATSISFHLIGTPRPKLHATAVFPTAVFPTAVFYGVLYPADFPSAWDLAALAKNDCNQNRAARPFPNGAQRFNLLCKLRPDLV